LLTRVRHFHKVLYCHRSISSAPKVEQMPMEKIRQKRNDLFTKEKERQLKWIARIEKIDVVVYARTADSLDGEERVCTLAMNKDLSTPYNCALHISEHVARSAALALVDGKAWDMHRPLNGNCQLKFLYFTDPDPSLVNRAYWRSCSFILGYILETSFTHSHTVHLHSWPSVNIQSGSFVYDVKFDEQLLNWQPTADDYRALSRTPLGKLREVKAPFEPLVVDIAVAEKMFEDNPLKLQQLASIAESSHVKGQIPLYRVHDHVDISRGNMINHTAQFGYYNVCAFHPIETKDFGRLCRVQGASVPFTQRVNSWAWEIVCKSAKKQNTLPLPSIDRYKVGALPQVADGDTPKTVSKEAEVSRMG